VTAKQADTAKRNIENLIKCKNTGAVMSTAIQEWLNDISDGLRKRLKFLGIIEQTDKKRYSLLEWVHCYIDNRPDVKETTRRKWRDVEENWQLFSVTIISKI